MSRALVVPTGSDPFRRSADDGAFAVGMIVDPQDDPIGLDADDDADVGEHIDHETFVPSDHVPFVPREHPPIVISEPDPFVPA